MLKKSKRSSKFLAMATSHNQQIIKKKCMCWNVIASKFNMEVAKDSFENGFRSLKCSIVGATCDHMPGKQRASIYYMGTSTLGWYLYFCYVAQSGAPTTFLCYWISTHIIIYCYGTGSMTQCFLVCGQNAVYFWIFSASHIHGYFYALY